MSAMASQITSLTIAYSTVYSGRSKNTSKLRVTGLCSGNSPVTGEFPAQMASNAENVSIWWRHHVISSAGGLLLPAVIAAVHFISLLSMIWDLGHVIHDDNLKYTSGISSGPLDTLEQILIIKWHFNQYEILEFAKKCFWICPQNVPHFLGASLH